MLRQSGTNGIGDLNSVFPIAVNAEGVRVHWQCVAIGCHHALFINKSYCLLGRLTRI